MDQHFWIILYLVLSVVLLAARHSGGDPREFYWDVFMGLAWGPLTLLMLLSEAWNRWVAPRPYNWAWRLRTFGWRRWRWKKYWITGRPAGGNVLYFFAPDGAYRTLLVHHWERLLAEAERRGVAPNDQELLAEWWGRDGRGA